MAIVQCLECGGNVSTRAEICPHCGYPAENYPSIAQSWGILGIMIATTAILVPLLWFFGPDPSGMSFGAQILIATLLGTGIPCWIVYLIRKKKTNIGSFNLTIENRRIIPLIVLVAIPLNLGIAGPLVELVPMTDFFREMIREMVLEMASDQGLLMFIALVIAAPILEELIFRGIMLDGLLRIYSPTKAVIVSSLLFGLIHLNPAQFVGGALVGGFMGWVYVHTRSVLATILIHAAFNLTAFTESYFIDVEEAIDMSYAEVLGGMTNYLLLIVGSVVVTLGCVFLLDKEFKKSATIARA
ncbi:MAG TPA: CPBP family intramembrane metalloprotease [Gemmatimonadetes bacterium]|nr:CPBP family intramembrane metalloprotease [Gemmatimonadota bacterium]